jgi:hypothetical protein
VVALGLVLWFATRSSAPDCGLHIVIFNERQANAIAMVSPDGEPAGHQLALRLLEQQR